MMRIMSIGVVNGDDRTLPIDNAKRQRLRVPGDRTQNYCLLNRDFRSYSANISASVAKTIRCSR